MSESTSQSSPAPMADDAARPFAESYSSSPATNFGVSDRPKGN